MQSDDPIEEVLRESDRLFSLQQEHASQPTAYNQLAPTGPSNPTYNTRSQHYSTSSAYPMQTHPTVGMLPSQAVNYFNTANDTSNQRYYPVNNSYGPAHPVATHADSTARMQHTQGATQPHAGPSAFYQANQPYAYHPPSHPSRLDKHTESSQMYPRDRRPSASDVASQTRTHQSFTSYHPAVLPGQPYTGTGGMQPSQGAQSSLGRSSYRSSSIESQVRRQDAQQRGRPSAPPSRVLKPEVLPLPHSSSGPPALTSPVKRAAPGLRKDSGNHSQPPGTVPTSSKAVPDRSVHQGDTIRTSASQRSTAGSSRQTAPTPVLAASTASLPDVVLQRERDKRSREQRRSPRSNESASQTRTGFAPATGRASSSPLPRKQTEPQLLEIVRLDGQSIEVKTRCFRTCVPVSSWYRLRREAATTTVGNTIYCERTYITAPNANAKEYELIITTLGPNFTRYCPETPETCKFGWTRTAENQPWMLTARRGPSEAPLSFVSTSASKEPRLLKIDTNSDLVFVVTASFPPGSAAERTWENWRKETGAVMHKNGLTRNYFVKRNSKEGKVIMDKLGEKFGSYEPKPSETQAFGWTRVDWGQWHLTDPSEQKAARKLAPTTSPSGRSQPSQQKRLENNSNQATSPSTVTQRHSPPLAPSHPSKRSKASEPSRSTTRKQAPSPSTSTLPKKSAGGRT